MKRFVLFGKALSEKCRKALCAYADEGICLPEYSALAKPVSSHPDTLLFEDGGRLFCGRGYYEQNTRIFEKLGVLPVLTDDPVSPYPAEARLNAFTVTSDGKIALIGREKSLAGELKEAYTDRFDVKQGYAHCLTAKVAENAFITSDRGIAEAVKRAGGDCLTVSAGSIALEACEYGFIGGASVLCERELLFFGDVTKHPDFEAMRDFCALYGTKPVSLSDEKLTDCGGAIFFE